MKTRILWRWNLGLALLVLPVASGCLQQAASAPETTAAQSPSVAPADLAIQVSDDQELASTAPTSDSDLEDAPVKPITTEKPLPPNIKPTSPLAEVIRLADSGVEEGVLLAYVTNSTSTFNLGSEEIIYLKDIGVSASVVTAMIQHDQALKELAAAQAAAATPAPESTPTASEPPAVETQPASGYSVENYPPPAPVAAVAEPVFYDSLAPYGTWVDVAGEGRCWQPTVVVVNPTWQPYLDCGRWVYSDCGWYWLSDYSWGWAPFHYGRWFRHHRLGWCWRPNTVWGPSWVCWRYSGDYCGWAPLPPRAWFSFSLGLTDCGRRISPVFDFGLTRDCFPFVHTRNLCDPHLRRHLLARDQVARIYNTTVASSHIVVNNHTVINPGLAPTRVAAATHTEIHTVSIREGSTPASPGRRERFEARGRTLAVFRPHFTGATGRAELTHDHGARAEVHGVSSHSVSWPTVRERAPGQPSARAEEPIATRATAPEHFAANGYHRSSEPQGDAPVTAPEHSDRSGSATLAGHPRTPPAPPIIHHSENKELSQSHGFNQAAAPGAHLPQAQTPVAAPDTFSHPGQTHRAAQASSPSPAAHPPSGLYWSGPNVKESVRSERQTQARQQEDGRFSSGFQNRFNARFNAALSTPQPAAGSHQLATAAHQRLAEAPHQFTMPAPVATFEVPRQFAAPTRSMPVEIPHQFAAPAHQTPVEMPHHFVAPAHQAAVEVPWHNSAPAFTPQHTYSAPAPSAPASHGHSSSERNSR
jgi:hypothetical protein